jgi:hypothetical protein
MSVISENGIEHLTWDGIFNANQGNLIIINSTISGNAGTGIDNEGDTTLDYVTFANNSSSLSSWGISEVTVRNSLFANSPCMGPSINPLGVNIDTDGTCGVSHTIPYDQLYIGPLALNGGPTFTHALLSNSPAIDAASAVPGITAAIDTCPPTDQRGEPRPSGAGCDLGAYEYQGVAAASISLVDTPTPTITPTPTLTPTATPDTSSCKWYEQDEMSLVLFDISPGTTDLTLYVKNPKGILGEEIVVEGDTEEWIYTAFLGEVEAEKCSFEGYAGRLHCYFKKLPVPMLDTTQVLKIFLNRCDERAIFVHEQVSIISPVLPPTATATTSACNSSLSRSDCPVAGGTYNCTLSACFCDCGP